MALSAVQTVVRKAPLLSSPQALRRPIIPNAGNRAGKPVIYRSAPVDTAGTLNNLLQRRAERQATALSI